MSGFHGVVYTKEWTVNLILDIAGYTADKQLWSHTIVEPSCGDGAFLCPIVKRLMAAAKRDDRCSVWALQKSLAAFDLSPDAVSISRERVSEVLLSEGMTQEEAGRLSEIWIQQADFLLDDTPSCDYIVGNPPYVRATDIPEAARGQYCRRFTAMTKGCDLYIAFVEKGLSSLRDEKSVLCYICADRWMQNRYGKKLRKLIAQYYHLDSVIRMHGVDAFENEVSAYPSVIRIDRNDGRIKYADCSPGFTESDVPALLSWLKASRDAYACRAFSAARLSQPSDGSIVPLADPHTVSVVTDMISKFPTLEETGVKLGIGLATGRDDVFIVDSPNLVEPERMLPAFNMRDWRRGAVGRESWLINPWNTDGSLAKIEDYPMFRSYMEAHRETIGCRHVAKKNADAWYRTIDKVNWSIYGVPMLLFPDMARRAEPVYSDGTKYPCHNCYWLVSDKWDLKVLGGLLMSDIAESFVDAMGVKMRGGTMRFQAQYLRLIHVPKPESISAEAAELLRTAFENKDRGAASRAAAIAYGLEG